MTRPVYYTTSYSYKGGSGRTTTTLNIAQALTALGADVVLIDADLGAGGVRAIWRAMLDRDTYDAPDLGTHSFLERWLRRKDGADSTLRGAFEAWDFWASSAGKATIDARLWPRVPLDVRQDRLAKTKLAAIVEAVEADEGLDLGEQRFAGELLVVPGVHKGYMPKGYSNSEPCPLAAGYRELGKLGLDYLEESRGWRARHRFVMLDSASGITHISLPSLLAANAILVFFRMSIQHHEGTTGNLPDLFDTLEDMHPECRFSDERERARSHQRVLAMATCVDPDTMRDLDKVSKQMPLARTVLDSYEEMEEYWEYIREAKGLPVFGRAMHYAGAFRQHPILSCRETGIFFTNAYEGDAEDPDTGERGPHEAYVRRCLLVAARLIKLSRGG